MITPAVKGSFVWLSQRSGTFKPEEPYALGATYVVTLAPGLKQLDGTAVEADFRETLTTPPMRLGGWNSPSYLNHSDAPAEPRFSLLFNANVNPQAAAAFIRYVNGHDESIPAHVEKAEVEKHADRYFPMWRTKDHSLKTWTERFAEKATVNGLEARPGMGGGNNHLWITPAHPLPAGDWRLVVQAGMPSTENNLHLAEAEEITIGMVRPFEVRNATPSNVIGGDRHIQITLSRSLPKEVTDKNIARWVRVEPAPANLQTKIDGREITFTGDFALGKEYQVIVAPGMPAAEPFVLAQEFRDTVTFDKIPSRLYFEEFATHQLSTGSPAVSFAGGECGEDSRDRTRLRGGRGAAGAGGLPELRRAAEKQRRYNGDEPYDKVDLDDIPNQMVWQHEYEVNAGEDEQKQIALDWNEILGKGQTGVVLLTADQIGKPAKPNARPGVQTLVQVTDLGIVWKESKGETFAHVFSLATGKAVEGAEVRVFNQNNEITNEAITDAAGVARVTTKTDSEWLLAAHGKDTHLIDFRNHSEGLSLRQLGIREGDFGEDDEGGADTWQALLFTERPVYKPGDTVHLKGIVRDWRENHPHVPAGAKATLRVTDARDRRILNQTLEISDVGSFSEDVKLPTSGLGTYNVELVVAEDGADAKAIGAHSFEVQEYTPNAFEIKIPVAPATIGQAEISLPITAQYYMGKALSQAKLTWSLDASDDGFQPAGFAAFDFCDSIRDYDLDEKLDRVSHFSDQGKLDLDATGKATVESTIPLNEKAPQPRLAHLLCEITDVDEQTVSQSSDFTIHSSDFYLGIRHLHDVVHEGEALPVDVIAVRTDGTPTPRAGGGAPAADARGLGHESRGDGRRRFGVSQPGALRARVAGDDPDAPAGEEGRRLDADAGRADRPR
ncbi:MAG: MG2 domain-containing protein [Chthoniobacter sp.]